MPSRLNTIARRRLANQHLVAPARRAAVDVVRRLGAVQAQDYGSAKWAIAQRSRGLTDAALEQVFASGAILRTHVLRPTWHFILPEDARWMLELTAPRIAQAMAYHTRQLELDATVFRKSHKVLEHALAGGNQLTRAELSERIERSGITVSGQRMAQLLMQAELDRLVISGARRGNQFTYALFDERVPRTPPRDRDEALSDLARRYFATRGPATLHDFAWWSGLSVTDAKRGIEAAGLVGETENGKAYWDVPGTRRTARWTRIAHLLPNYDEYFVGFRDRTAVAERLRTVGAKTKVDGLLGHGIFIDGQFVGSWRRTVGAVVEVRLRPLLKLTAAERGLVRRAVQRFGQFLGLPVQVRG